MTDIYENPIPEHFLPMSRRRIQTVIVGESMTHQSAADSCDVNQIMARYDRTGVLPPSARQGVFADVTSLQVDLTEAVNSSRATIKEFREFERTAKSQPPSVGEGTSPPDGGSLSSAPEGGD